MSIVAFLAGLAATAAVPQSVEIPGPMGSLSGTYVAARPGGPVVVIVPGSGPTDRDGNNPIMVKAAPYRWLAAALQERNIASLRFDKRGQFGSKQALSDPNHVTIADFASDVRAWAAKARTLAHTKCAWIAGHSEGGLISLVAAQDPNGICGVITIAGPGRKIGAVMREQLRANPANAPILGDALAAIDTLEQGGNVDESHLPAPLRPLFSASLQPYFRDLVSYDPAALARTLRVPILIIQGDRDIQVSLVDAKALRAARPTAKMVIVPDANHVLKEVKSDDRAANLATYGDPNQPVAPGIADAMAQFIRARG
jgi:pimeloyl-ACP methyl ester carboxylesterase